MIAVMLRRLWVLLLVLAGAAGVMGCRSRMVMVRTMSEVDVNRMPHLAVLPFVLGEEVQDAAAGRRMADERAAILRDEGGYEVTRIRPKDLPPGVRPADVLEPLPAVKAARDVGATVAVVGYLTRHSAARLPETGRWRHACTLKLSAVRTTNAAVIVRREVSGARYSAANDGSAVRAAEKMALRRLRTSFIPEKRNLPRPEEPLRIAAGFEDGKPVGRRREFKAGMRYVPLVVALPKSYDRALVVVRVRMGKRLLHRDAYVWNGKRLFHCTRVRIPELLVLTGGGRYRVECFVSGRRLASAKFVIEPHSGLPPLEDTEFKMDPLWGPG